jgi:alanine racemase
MRGALYIYSSACYDPDMGIPRQSVYTKKTVRTWIEIDTKAIAANVRVFRKIIGPKTKLLGVVKSNAYGHNIYEFSRVLERNKVDWLGVDSLIEAVRIREEGIGLPILVLGFTLPSLYELASNHNIILTLSSFEQLEEMVRGPMRKKPLRVHIKLDTGMHRQGFQWNEEKRLFSALSAARIRGRMRVEGFYTHFAQAKEPSRTEATDMQIREFERWRAAFRAHGYDAVLAHASATGGTLVYPNARYDMVRVGIGLYGHWPSEETKRLLSKRISLSPVLTWRAVVGEVKEVAAGERIGYDFTETLTRLTRVAIVPVGYWHGLRRALSSKGRVLIKGRSAKILGRVSMDMIAVDVSDIPGVKMGTEVTLIGRDGKEEISLEELARFIGTSSYEVLTSLNPLMQRFYQ